MVHCAHRNPTVPEHYTWDMAINDTAIHEVDTMRWLLGEEFVSARVDKPKKTSLRFEHLQDPLVLVLETESGVRVDDEIFVNCQFGYDIRCEAVAEKGTVSLGDQNAIVVRDGVGRAQLDRPRPQRPLLGRLRHRGAGVDQRRRARASTRARRRGTGMPPRASVTPVSVRSPTTASSRSR